MAEKKTFPEKIFEGGKYLTLGLLGLAVITASATLAMAAAVHGTTTAIGSQEYQKWKKRQNAKK